MYNDYMYAIDRSDEYLEHYGIKGMRWGVRKAIERGGTGLGNRRLARQYRKAQKKLAKLEARANNGAKYAKRAAALGAGAAAAGGLAYAGTGNIARGVAKLGGHAANAATSVGKLMSQAPGHSAVAKWSRRTGSSLRKAGSLGGSVHGTGSIVKGAATASKAINDWGNSTSISKAAGRAVGNVKLGKNASKALVNATGSNAAGLGEKIKKSGVTNNTIARIGAGALGAGLGAAAGYNAYRAATTKKAAQKAAQFRQEMNKTFAGTAYGKQGGSKKRRRR